MDSSICVAVMTGLRCSDGAADDVLLNGGDFFRRDFHAEVSARDHDAVGGFQNFFEVLNGLWFFELGDDPGVRAESGDALLDELYVVAGADEGDGDGVDSVLYGELQVGLVLFGERGHAHRNSREVDAFVFAEQAAVDDLALDVVALDGEHAQLNQAVGEEDAGSGLKIFGEGLEGGGEDLGVSGNVARSDGDVFAGVKLDRCAVFQLSGANFGALQVAENTDVFAFLGGDLADHFHELQFFRVRSVGKVQARDVESGAQQRAKSLLGV